ncbi:hypothetical protein MA16_Dca006601 [Dendrobium catenatum]|uniref:Uncharacterized protein n=1 Tax=Dendrobium catenatum TaxID=906689 RepID=A0A2I0X5M1_9ASPA|nr:hypothetical protein MA16_Dca006601 [Dendrobium catenatum]
MATVASEDVGQQEGNSDFAGQQSPSIRRAGTAKVLVGKFLASKLGGAGNPKPGEEEEELGDDDPSKAAG